MNDFAYIIENIPIKHNSVSYILFLGICIGLLLTFVILFRSPGKNTAFSMFGWSVGIQSIIAIDIFLCYTGLMKYSLEINDATEPLVLLLAPSTYLFVYALLERKPIQIKKHWYHIIPSVLYFLSQTGYYLQPLPVKLNAYLGAYFPDISGVTVPEGTTYNYLWIKNEFRWLVLFSFITYILLSLLLLLKHFSHHNYKTKDSGINKYQFSRNTTLTFLAIFVLVFIVFLNFEDDAGDHYIFIFFTIIVTVTCFVLLSESRFFQNSWIADKYETSGSKAKEISINTIRNFIEEQQLYTSPLSLKSLADHMGISGNYISQTINTQTGLNFNEFINRYRIEESKKRLTDPTYNHLTIEAIGNSVGFKSKSTFYTAFKKYTQMSPKQFMDQQ